MDSIKRRHRAAGLMSIVLAAFHAGVSSWQASIWKTVRYVGAGSKCGCRHSQRWRQRTFTGRHNVAGRRPRFRPACSPSSLFWIFGTRWRPGQEEFPLQPPLDHLEAQPQPLCLPSSHVSHGPETTPLLSCTHTFHPTPTAVLSRTDSAFASAPCP